MVVKARHWRVAVAASALTLMAAVPTAQGQATPVVVRAAVDCCMPSTRVLGVSSGYAAPATYRTASGTQFIVVATGAGAGAELVACSPGGQR